MYPTLNNVSSPSTPIPPTSQQSAFEFSPSVINRIGQFPSPLNSLQDPWLWDISPPNVHSRSASLLTPSRTSRTPRRVHLSPGYSSIVNGQFTPASPFGTADSNSSFSDVDLNDDNRTLDFSSILDDLGLQQYEEMFMKAEIGLAQFMLLKDRDLQAIGITDKDKREIFMMAIDNLKLL